MLVKAAALFLVDLFQGERSPARPSPPLRRAKLNNVALVPANLLPYKSQWQAIANGLADDGVLMILPK